jgi:hypothetical protein
MDLIAGLWHCDAIIEVCSGVAIVLLVAFKIRIEIAKFA